MPRRNGGIDPQLGKYLQERLTPQQLKDFRDALQQGDVENGANKVLKTITDANESGGDTTPQQ